MKYTLSTLATALVASAAVVQRQTTQCCFEVSVSGGANGTLGQLDDGQNRIGPGYSPATYCLQNGVITDQSGRGCILTAPTTQFQCDSGASPSPGFSVSSSGQLLANGTDMYYACPATSNGVYNIYTQPVAGQAACVEVTLSTVNGACAGAGVSSSSSSVKASSTVASSSVVASSASSTVASTSTVASSASSTSKASASPASSSVASSSSAAASSSKVSSSSAAASSSAASTTVAPVTTTIATTVPTTTTSTPKATSTLSSSSSCVPTTVTITNYHTVTVTAPCTSSTGSASSASVVSASASSSKPASSSAVATSSAAQSSSTMASSSAVSSTASSTSVVSSSKAASNSVVASSSVATSSSASAVSSSVVTSSSKAASSSVVAPSSTAASSSVVASSSSSAPATTSAPAKTSAASPTAASTSSAPSSTSTCPVYLTGSWQYPHLIVPISSSSPSTAYGTVYSPEISSTMSTIFNFDIPASYAGKTCTLVFGLPAQAQLETSSFTLSSAGSIDFKQLASVATQSTTYANAPAVEADLGTHVITAGSGVTVATGPCAAGETISYELSAVGGLGLVYFQDYNPCPIGLYILEN